MCKKNTLSIKPCFFLSNKKRFFLIFFGSLVHLYIYIYLFSPFDSDGPMFHTFASGSTSYPHLSHKHVCEDCQSPVSPLAGRFFIKGYRSPWNTWISRRRFWDLFVADVLSVLIVLSVDARGEGTCVLM